MPSSKLNRDFYTRQNSPLTCIPNNLMGLRRHKPPPAMPFFGAGCFLGRLRGAEMWVALLYFLRATMTVRWVGLQEK